MEVLITILSILLIISSITVALYGFKILKYADYIPIWRKGWSYFIIACILVILRRTLETSNIAILESEIVTYSISIISMIFMIMFIHNISNVFRNITKLNNESRFITLVKHLPAGVVIYDEKGTIVYANERSNRTLGKDFNLEGLCDNDLREKLDFEKEDESSLKESEFPSKLVLSTGKSFYHNIYKISKKDDPTKQKWLLCNGYMTKNGHKQVVLLFVDITDLKNSEKACRLSEDMYRKAFMSSHDAIVISRITDGLFYSVNRSFTKLSGYSEDDIKGRSTIEINLWKDIEDRNYYVKTLKNKGCIKDFKAQFIKKDGSVFNGLVSASTIEINGEKCIFTSVKQECIGPFNRRKEDKKNKKEEEK